MKRTPLPDLVLITIFSLVSLAIKSEKTTCMNIGKAYKNQLLIQNTLLLDNEERIYYKPEIFFIKI